MAAVLGGRSAGTPTLHATWIAHTLCLLKTSDCTWCIASHILCMYCGLHTHYIGLEVMYTVHGSSNDLCFACHCRAISRDVYRGERPVGVQYSLAIKTSDRRGAGTSANVFLIMHGHQASGAHHHLTATPHDFDRCAASFIHRKHCCSCSHGTACRLGCTKLSSVTHYWVTQHQATQRSTTGAVHRLKPPKTCLAMRVHQ